jgi:hypothetical protein
MKRVVSGFRPSGVSLAIVVLIGLAGDAASAQSMPEGPEMEWPFRVGEQFEYDVTFGPVKVGVARLQVEALENLDGTPSYRVAFELEGGPFFYKIDDRTVSWIATDPLRSMQFEQILAEGSYRRHRRYAFDHGALTYTREDWDEDTDGYLAHAEERDVPIPPAALDEIAYLYLARLLPLTVGRTYRFDRYFEEEGNPVILEVLRRQRVRVAAGRFDTIVVRPIIQTDGMFGEGGQAEVYLTGDERRIVVQIKTRMKVGELNMYLRGYELGGND